MYNEYIYPLISYLLGSIPFGLILSECFGKGNLRQTGSKNIGSTNVLRTQGKTLGALTLLLDFSKAFFPCYFFMTNNEFCNLLIISAPTLGHIFPIWLKFKGGKGVATYFGTITAISWSIGISTATLWLVVFIMTRISSISCLMSIIGSLVVFQWNYNATCKFEKFFILFLLVIIIIIKHKDNIYRLWNNEEKKL